MKKEIIRKTKTQAKLKKVLSQLLINNDIQDITTTQICKSANVNRSTFYTNYYDQYDLYDDLKKDLLEECYKTLSNAFFDKETIKSFLLLIKSNKIIQSFLIKTTDNSFVNALKENEIKQISNNIGSQWDATYIDYITDFVIDGAFAIIIRWIKNRFDKEVTDISSLIINIIKNMNLSKINKSIN